MHYYLVATVKQAIRNQKLLTYYSDQILEVGQIVLVPLGRQQTIGVVYKKVVQPKFPTKSVLEVIKTPALPTELLQLYQWLSDYYFTDLPQVLASALPTGLNKKRRGSKKTQSQPQIQSPPIVPTNEQQQAINKIWSSKINTTILHGITGSGKTTVYLELAQKTIKLGRSAIIIVPEIALTEQLISQFQAHFPNIVLLHSHLTEAQRHLNWLKCLNSKEPIVVIGARSAIFAPIKQVGLIVIDEFHEASLKQDKNPRYATTRVAAKLAQLHQAKLVLGSATPTISEYWLAKQKNGQIIKLSQTARPTKPPKVELIDMTKKSSFTQHSFLSDSLLLSIRNSLTTNQQALLFHNRRGSSSNTICRDCGWVATCKDCEIPLTLHHDKFKLVCHLCGLNKDVPLHCPKCGSANVDHNGIGTKLIEKEIAKHFPEAKIARFDADSSKDATVDKLYHQLVSGEFNILIGTQVVTKGLNLPNLATVGIIQADTGLSLPDYITEERNFQQIAQVVGRVGRDKRSTTVIVQTYQPNQPSIQLGITQNYAEFYNKTIVKRQQFNYPPFCHLIKLKVSYKTEAACIRQAQKVSNLIQDQLPRIEIIGPAPAFYEKARGQYHWQLIIKTRRRQDFKTIISLLPNSHWQYDPDPHSLIW